MQLTRRSLRDDAHDALLDMLLTGALTPYEELSIDRLARVLGVSPTPVREALVELEHTRLIERTALKGYRVSPPLGATQVLQLLTARTIVEVGALEQALKDRDALIASLEQAHAAHVAAEAELNRREPGESVPLTVAKQYIEADWQFHSAILRHSGNTYLESFAKSLSSHLHRLRQLVGGALDDASIAVAEHEAILSAIVDSPTSTKRPVAALRKHLEAVRTRSVADADALASSHHAHDE